MHTWGWEPLCYVFRLLYQLLIVSICLSGLSDIEVSLLRWTFKTFLLFWVFSVLAASFFSTCLGVPTETWCKCWVDGDSPETGLVLICPKLEVDCQSHKILWTHNDLANNQNPCNHTISNLTYAIQFTFSTWFQEFDLSLKKVQLVSSNQLAQASCVYAQFQSCLWQAVATHPVCRHLRWGWQHLTGWGSGQCSLTPHS